MKWLESIWSVVKHWITPIVAYFKGRIDQRAEERSAQLEAENEFLKKNNDRVDRIRAKWLRRRKDREAKLRNDKT